MTSIRPRTGVTTSFGRSNPNPVGFYQVPEGKYTFTIYTFIKDHKYNEVVTLLAHELPENPDDRSILSLLAYCYYQLQHFPDCASCYEKLIKLFPNEQTYKLYYAQALFKCGDFLQSEQAALTLDSKELTQKMLMLQASIKFELNDVEGCRTLIDRGSDSDVSTLINRGCLLLKESSVQAALDQFQQAFKHSGYKNDLSYYIALCHFKLKRFSHSLKHITEIIDRGLKEHPEFHIVSVANQNEITSVGNSQALHESFLIEAFNLKAAIEHAFKNFPAALEALTDMPPRLESELDAVTLHNMALFRMNSDATGGFEKLCFLIDSEACPPETFRNLLLLSIKYDHFDFAADLLAAYESNVAELLDPDVNEFVQALLLTKTSPDEAFAKLDEMSVKCIEQLRLITKQVQESRQTNNHENIDKFVADYDLWIERYIPVLMAQAKIFWDQENYSMVEKIFRKSVEFCSENESWKLNVAHVLFMQESKYKEAISFYEPLLEVPAIILANLCVAYIMTSQNEEAEELMVKVEKDEERAAFDDANKKTYHLCIVNMVIGTLYCAKGNYEFGISRIIKSLEPFDQKLSTDTWFYAKRCIVALFEALTKHMMVLKDSTLSDIFGFFDACELNGASIPSIIDPFSDAKGSTWNRPSLDESKFRNTVATEARRLKSLFLQLYD